MQKIWFHAAPNRADTENFGKFEAAYLDVPYLHQSNGDTKTKLRVWRA